MFAKPTAIPGMDVAMGGLLTPLGHSAAVTNAAETETNVGQGHVTLLSGTPGRRKDDDLTTPRGHGSRNWGRRCDTSRPKSQREPLRPKRVR